MKLSKVTEGPCGEKENPEALWKPLEVVPELDGVPRPDPICLGCWGSHRKAPASCWGPPHALEECRPMELRDGTGVLGGCPVPCGSL